MYRLPWQTILGLPQALERVYRPADRQPQG